MIAREFFPPFSLSIFQLGEPAPAVKVARGPSGLVRALSLSLSVWSNSPQNRPGSAGRSSRQGLRRRPRRPRRGIPRRLSSSVGGGAPLRREERGERPGSRSPAAAAAEKGGAAAASPAPDEASGVPQSRFEEGGPLLGRGEEPRCFCCRRRRGQRRVRGAGLLFWLFFPFCYFFLFFCFCCGSRCHCQGEAALQGDGGSCVGVGAGYFSRSRTVSVAVFLAPSKKEQKTPVSPLNSSPLCSATSSDRARATRRSSWAALAAMSTSGVS